jgi:hypothetical protein
MYMSDLRHIHDPVLSSLKMEVIVFFFVDLRTEMQLLLCAYLRMNNVKRDYHIFCWEKFIFIQGVNFSQTQKSFCFLKYIEGSMFQLYITIIRTSKEQIQYQYL